LCTCRLPPPALENERTRETERKREIERYFFALCPPEAIRRGKENKKRKTKGKSRKRKNRKKIEKKIKMNYLFIKLLFINYINYIIIGQ
jgi:hypothetical protein